MSQPLNLRQQEFVRHLTVGAGDVRGNATAAYTRAGYRTAHPEIAGPRLARKPHVRSAIAAAHASAETAAGSTLRDWKLLSVDAQETVFTISRGLMPGTSKRPRLIRNRDDAAAAKVALDACLEILDRGYPKKLLVRIEDPGAELAKLLGVKPDQIPEE